jgi:hypothetical protein
MFNQVSANIAAQKQAGLFEEGPEEFALVSQDKKGQDVPAVSKEDLSAAAHALAVLSAACSRIQSEQPARRFFSPEAMAEVDRLNLVLSIAAR